MSAAQAEEYAGRVVITWPGVQPGRDLPTWGIILVDADREQQLVWVTGVDFSLRADSSEPVVAELTMLTDTDGKPLWDGAPIPPRDEDGNFRTGRFRWLVAEMRVAS